MPQFSPTEGHFAFRLCVVGVATNGRSLCYDVTRARPVISYVARPIDSMARYVDIQQSPKMLSTMTAPTEGPKEVGGIHTFHGNKLMLHDVFVRLHAAGPTATGRVWRAQLTAAH